MRQKFHLVGWIGLSCLLGAYDAVGQTLTDEEYQDITFRKLSPTQMARGTMSARRFHEAALHWEEDWEEVWEEVRELHRKLINSRLAQKSLDFFDHWDLGNNKLAQVKVLLMRDDINLDRKELPRAKLAFAEALTRVDEKNSFYKRILEYLPLVHDRGGDWASVRNDSPQPQNKAPRDSTESKKNAPAKVMTKEQDPLPSKPNSKESPAPLTNNNPKANHKKAPSLPIPTKPQAKSDSILNHADPGTQNLPKPESKPESKPELKPQSKPEPKPEPKPASKPESKPALKTMSETKPRVDIKVTTTTPKSKPAAKAAEASPQVPVPTPKPSAQQGTTSKTPMPNTPIPKTLTVPLKSANPKPDSKVGTKERPKLSPTPKSKPSAVITLKTKPTASRQGAPTRSRLPYGKLRVTSDTAPLMDGDFEMVYFRKDAILTREGMRNDWIMVTSPEFRGWIRAEDVDLPQAKTVRAKRETRVFDREKLLGKIAPGEQFTVERRQGVWLLITVPSRTGWIHRRHVIDQP